jgi:4-carboxymuconolactone decarboxylase
MRAGTTAPPQLSLLDPFFPSVVSALINFRPRRPTSYRSIRRQKTIARAVEQIVGSISPGLVEDTGAVLFRDLWLRPDLATRDRSVVTVAALSTSGQFAQIGYHLGRAMDNGLTCIEASEMVSHLAYYAGWPSAFSAVPVAKGVFESRVE